MENDVRLIYVTVKDKSEAQLIGRAMVEGRLAACANVIEGMTSIYQWNGSMEEAHEAVLLLKTVARHVPDLIDAVKRLHSYDVPCVLSIPVETGNPVFLDWVRAQTF